MKEQTSAYLEKSRELLGRADTETTHARARPSMYQPPQTSDFRRNLIAITEKAEAEAHAERLRIHSDAIKKGAGQSNRVIIAIIISFEEIYYKTVEDTAQLISDFVERTQFTPPDLGEIARPELESFAEQLLGQLPDAGFPQDTTRLRAEYREKFRQRAEGALRDIEIGFIGGRKVTTAGPPPASEAAVKFSDAVTLKPTLWGMSIDLPKAWKWVRDGWRNARRQ